MSSIALDSRSWGEQEFGHTRLGHQARTNRVVNMAQRMYEAPNGHITRIFTRPCELEGAYRALESEHLDADELGRASTVAAVRRAAEYDQVYIPIDGTSLVFDSTSAPGLSEIGTKQSTKTGLHIQNSILVAPGGEVLGVGHQEYFCRKRRLTKLTREQRRAIPFEKKESRYWLDCIQKTEECFVSEGVTTPRTYVMDRGADILEVLEWANKATCRVIIRSSFERTLLAENGEKQEEARYLKQQIQTAPIHGHYRLPVSAAYKRTERVALMQVQVEHYTFRLKSRQRGKAISRANLWVVRAHEISPVPDGEAAIEWRLLCNRPVEDFEKACEVLHAYRCRWRIEEMHRCLKTVCGVEDSQLRSVDALRRFATMMSSVAARIEQLKTVSRAQPDAPATQLFTVAELQVIMHLHFRDKPLPTDPPTCEQAVCWLAQMGGYIGPRNGLPGQETIGRGLEKLRNIMEYNSIINRIDDDGKF